MKREVLVDLEALNDITKYMVNRPYKEVVGLLDNLKSSIREIPDEKETKKKQDYTIKTAQERS